MSTRGPTEALLTADARCGPRRRRGTDPVVESAVDFGAFSARARAALDFELPPGSCLSQNYLAPSHMTTRRQMRRGGRLRGAPRATLQPHDEDVPPNALEEASRFVGELSSVRGMGCNGAAHSDERWKKSAQNGKHEQHQELLRAEPYDAEVAPAEQTGLKDTCDGNRQRGGRDDWAVRT